jgi:hypothetical protein
VVRGRNSRDVGGSVQSSMGNSGCDINLVPEPVCPMVSISSPALRVIKLGAEG